jgi:hypothetical protein
VLYLLLVDASARTPEPVSARVTQSSATITTTPVSSRRSAAAADQSSALTEKSAKSPRYKLNSDLYEQDDQVVADVNTPRMNTSGNAAADWSASDEQILATLNSLRVPHAYSEILASETPQLHSRVTKRTASTGQQQQQPTYSSLPAAGAAVQRPPLARTSFLAEDDDFLSRGVHDKSSSSLPARLESQPTISGDLIDLTNSPARPAVSNGTRNEPVSTSAVPRFAAYSPDGDHSKQPALGIYAHQTVTFASLTDYESSLGHIATF